MNLKKLLLEENVGGYDLLIRALAGTIALTALAMNCPPYPWKWILALVAFGGLYTAITRHCTPYSLIGFSTKRR